MDALIAAAARSALGLLHTIAEPRLSILIFHRVTARQDELFPYEPDASRFDRLMRFVARSFCVLSLGQAASFLGRGNLPRRSLVITFDDGYRDNAEVALPLLQRHGLGATFFVSTGFLDGGRMWNDSVIEAIRRSSRSDLDLGFLGSGRMSLEGLAARRSVIRMILARIKYMSPAERDEFTGRVQRAAGVSCLPDTLMMRSEHVRQLHRAGMEVGAHTVNHPILAVLDPAEAESEISDGRRRIEEIIDAPVQVFAYPNGKPGQDYDERHVAMLLRQGFRAAVSTAPGVARAGDNVLELPRFTPYGPSLLTWAGRLVAHQRQVRYAVATGN